MGCIISRVDDKEYESLSARLLNAIKTGKITDYGKKPTHVIDIYKMRRGQYKNVRIWCKIDLGNGERTDLFMTRIDNEPMAEDEIVDLFKDATEQEYCWKEDYIQPEEILRKESYEF